MVPVDLAILSPSPAIGGWSVWLARHYRSTGGSSVRVTVSPGFVFCFCFLVYFSESGTDSGRVQWKQGGP